jgi:hypothetical protein
MSLDNDFSDAVDELEDNVSRGHDNLISYQI